MAMPPGPFSPAAVEQICRVLGDALTGSEIPNLIAPLNAPAAPGEETNTKWKRLFNAVATAQNRQQDGRPLVRLILAVMNPVRFSSQVRYDECRAYRSRLRTEACRERASSVGVLVSDSASWVSWLCLS